MITKSTLQSKVFKIQDLGLIPYHQAYALQQRALTRVLDGGGPSLLLCEHPAVLTMGRLATNENFRQSLKGINEQGIDILRIDRGGEVTLHSPGQLIVYPIINLQNYKRDLRYYLYELEEVVIELLQEFGIMAKRLHEHTGVWVGTRKIASMGVGVKKWVTYHGLGLNVTTNLNLFSIIRPCGLDVQMTSMQQQLGYGVSMTDVKERVISVFDKRFCLKDRGA